MLIDMLMAEPRQVLLLAGSGMSRSAGIPTGDDLIGKLAARRGMRPVPSPVEWYHATFGRWPSYEALLYEADDTPERSDPAEFFAPAPGENGASQRVPGRAHRALAELVGAGYFRLILTTNFDRLIETAISDAGLPVTVARLPSEMTVPRDDRPHVVKLHGDYADLVPKVLPRRQGAYAAEEIRAFLGEVFARHHVLVCGWSGSWDVALAAALAQAPPARSVCWLTAVELCPAALSVVRARNATVITIADADSFFDGLADRLLPAVRT